MLADLIVKMRNELNAHENGYVQRFEVLLGQVYELNDPACIGELLQFFDDNAEFDEMMFSIIHTVEYFDCPTYVRAVVDHLISFFEKSPGWAITMHMRILNSPITLAAYADCITTLPNEKRDVVRKVLEAVRKKSAKCVSRCDSLLAVI